MPKRLWPVRRRFQHSSRIWPRSPPSNRPNDFAPTNEKPGDLVKNSAILLVECPDQKGIVAAIANFVLRYDGNILHADQHQAPEQGLFLCRVEWELGTFGMDMKEFPRAFGPIAEQFK